MANINPVPTTRVGDYFVRQRLISQTQSDQLDLFRIQTQISTGRRLQFASDDAPAALRAITLQRLLDRKAQVQTNVKANEQFLSAAAAQFDGEEGIASTLIKLRASMIGVSGNLTNEEERQQAINEIDVALEALVKAGNAKYQGQYLFAGSRSQDQPYDFNGEFVEYFGNEGDLRSYVDIERLFDTNLAGTEVFGGISSKLQGIDLNPHLNADTLLSTINGGSGIGRNSAITLSVNNGTSTVSTVVDLSKAVTLGDVARLIEQGAPAGTEVLATVTGTGLSLQLTNPAIGTIAVSEVAQGRTASELGILTPIGAPPSNLVTGSALNPAVLSTTKLNDLLGTKAQGQLVSPVAENNDIVLTARRNGAAFNNTHVVFVHDNSVVAGNEFAVYGGNTLTLHIQSGFSTASQVAAAITAEGTFQAAVDYRDATAPAQAGSNPVQALDFGLVTSGGSGEVLDIASGLVITNGGNTATLNASNVDTVEEFLNLVNGANLGLVAEINAARNGINVRSRLNGADLTIGENGGRLATQLGIRTFTADSKLADFNRGLGVQATTTLETLDTGKLDSVRIVARDGTTLNVSLAGATSLQDVANAINGALGNNTGTTAVLARLSQNGNRLELVDSSSVTTGSLIVQAVPGTQAAEYLGLVETGASEKSSTTTNATGDYLLSGGNVMGNDFVIQARDGTELWIDLAGAKTVADVLERINTNIANTGSPPKITAELATHGNGIQLIDASTGTGSLRVGAVEGSQAAELLGFVPKGQTQVSSTTVGSGGTYVLQSADRNTVESDSVFNTLVRLKQAIQENNTQEIGRTIDRLDVDLNRVNFARSEMGSRLQSLQVIRTKLEDENVQLRSALSDDMDVDLVEAISNLTARQYALQASLQTSASILQLSLLNFI